MHLIRSSIQYSCPRIDTRYFFEEGNKLPIHGWLFPCFGCGAITCIHAHIIPYSNIYIKRYRINLTRFIKYEIPYCKKCCRHRPEWISKQILILFTEVKL